MIVEPRVVAYINSLDSGNSDICNLIEKEELNDQYSFDDDIAVCIYDNLTINITELLKQ